jgi:DNA-binding NarL/FixJ family response regulator
MDLQAQCTPIATAKNCPRCGQEFYSPVAERVCGACRKPKIWGREPVLSLRERQIVALIRQAKMNKEIAYELHLSEGTVKDYLSIIFRKLDLKNRTELAIWALPKQKSDRITP